MNSAVELETGLATGAVLFSDLVGFTEFNDHAGDRAALQVLEAQTEMAETVVSTRDGARIVKELGDGLMLWFASAADGLMGAVDFSTAADASRRNGFPLAIRMGLHYGSCIPRGDDLIGQTVNIAARVSDLAGPGELLVSEAVLDYCRESASGVELEPVGPVTVKGVSEPIWLQRVACHR